MKPSWAATQKIKMNIAHDSFITIKKTNYSDEKVL